MLQPDADAAVRLTLPPMVPFPASVATVAPVEVPAATVVEPVAKV